MAIIVMAYRVVEDLYLVTPKKVESFNNDHDFDFNIGDPAQWYLYLRKRSYPIMTKKGSPIAFRVYTWGGITGVPRKGSCTTLFPKGPNGEKIDVGKYGRLDKAEKYWLARLKDSKK